VESLSILRRIAKQHPAVSPPAQVISVTSCSGSLTSGPTVGLEIRLPEVGLLTLDMRRDEAYDLANELLAAVAMAQRKHEREFGRGWSDAG
jgi:hypothetical protein